MKLILILMLIKIFITPIEFLNEENALEAEENRIGLLNLKTSLNKSSRVESIKYFYLYHKKF
jgi:hypothetical protein